MPTDIWKDKYDRIIHQRKRYLRQWITLLIIGLTCTLFVIVILVYRRKHGHMTVEFIEDMPNYSKRSHSLSGLKPQTIVNTLLEQWPAGKPKAFVYFLINSKPESVDLFLNGLCAFERNFNQRFQYPVIIFHEHDFQPSGKLRIEQVSDSFIIFQEVNFTIPSFLTDPVPVEIPECNKPVGYRHMCRFHSRLFMDQPITQRFDYYMRLDDDSEINRPIYYDIFKFMSDNEYMYGYIDTIDDNQSCVKGLWSATKAYIMKNHISPTFFNIWPEPKMFYTNFEVSSVKLWQDLRIRKYIDYIDHLGGIYYTRWGDAPIKSLALSLFVQEKQLHKFSDVWYTHQNMSYPTIGTLILSYVDYICYLLIFLTGAIFSVYFYLCRNNFSKFTI